MAIAGRVSNFSHTRVGPVNLLFRSQFVSIHYRTPLEALLATQVKVTPFIIKY